MDEKWDPSSGHRRRPCSTRDTHHRMGNALWKPSSPTREPWKVYHRHHKRSHYAAPGGREPGGRRAVCTPRKHVPPQKKTHPVSRLPNATLVLYPPSPFGLSCNAKFELVPGHVVRVLVVSPCCTLPRFSKVACLPCCVLDECVPFGGRLILPCYTY